MLIPGFYPGIAGAERQAQALSKALIANGWRVNVLTRRHTGYAHLGDLPAKDEVDGIPLTRLYSRGAAKVRAVLYVINALWYLLRRGRRGIYHAHDIGSVGWLAVAARYLLGGRCLVKLRGGYSYYQRRFSAGFGRWQFSALLRLVDRVIVVNSEVERLVRDLGIPPHRVARIPNSTDTGSFRPASAAERLMARERLGLSPEQRVCLYVGRLEPIKGVDVLLRAWALVPEGLRRESRLVLVGDGGENGNLHRMIESLDIGDSVSLRGLQTDVRDYYWASDLFLLPSRSEGMSNAMVEAMACGLPVVASNVGGALDVVEEGGNGVLFESEDHHELARKLRSTLQMRDRWPEMGARARQTVASYAALDVAADRMDDLYRRFA